ncbi:putative serpin-Z8 [Hordeum vulgare]|nr:putative serpin-Z8 [Hordeum vulgare]
MADLAVRLTKRFADANSGKNLAFSPLSIYAVLAVLAHPGRDPPCPRRAIPPRACLRDRSEFPKKKRTGRSPTGCVWSDLTRSSKYCQGFNKDKAAAMDQPTSFSENYSGPQPLDAFRTYIGSGLVVVKLHCSTSGASLQLVRCITDLCVIGEAPLQSSVKLHCS